MNRIRTLEIDHIYTDHWFSTKGQRQYSRERIVFSPNYAGTIGYPYTKKNYSTQRTLKIDSIESILYIKCKTTNILKENIAEKVYYLD